MMQNNIMKLHKKRAEKTRKIIQTTLELIGNRGFDKFFIREIAWHIVFTPAVLYEYLTSKESLLSALC